MRRTSRPLRPALAALLLIGSAAPELRAQERNLYWRSISVNATLDAEGNLRVRERQVMVFTGDWNGGERRFDVRPRQAFTFHRLLRVDSVTRTERPLVEGDLGQVDHYGWSESRTLRWRSRLPSDPFFLGTAIEYVLEFTYSNVLVLRDGRFVLDHDFAFADRVGLIESFELDLAIDPIWRVPPGFEGRFRPGPIPPGRGFVVTLPLEYTGAARPAGVEFPAGALTRSLLAALLFSGIAWLIARLIGRERSLGRFAPLTDVEAIDERWLQERVFRHRPELVGAAWDDTTGAAEVAAVLARLVAEGKLTSQVRSNGRRFFRQDVLALELLASRGDLDDYERTLIDSLFFDGSNWTDTVKVREHYKKSGFDPSSKISGPLKRLVKGMHTAPPALPKPSAGPTAIMVLAALALLGAGIVRLPADAPLAAAGVAIGVGVFIWAAIAAVIWRNRVDRLASRALTFLIPLGLYSAVLLAALVGGMVPAGALVLAGLTLFCLALWRSVTNLAMSRDSLQRLEFRRSLAAAREYFAAELRKEEPKLRDEWFPYLIGFGLASHMDRWFRAFGGAESRPMTTSAGAFSGSAGRSGPGPSWTGFGGGGGFSGGGASASWAAAASSMAAGVSAPSSGSSSGGGGGGGGSSGGGGGGGW